MQFNILTLFPDMFPGALAHSITGRALEKGLWSLNAVNIRDFATDKHKTVDDTPYGGGAGMLMKADVIGRAIESLNIETNVVSDTPVKKRQKIIYLSPRGKLLNQRILEEFSKLESLTILCGHYEGVDQRVIDKYEIEEVSIGDYILTGGEIATYILIDACIRHINGVLGNAQTHDEESFSSGLGEDLLEYPHYTRPETWNGLDVPEVLKSGNHAKINEWRKEQAKLVTKKVRPDLWKKYLSSLDT